MTVDDFLVEDYKLQIDYLNSHFSRMWTRFNFFLTLESGLIAFMLISNNAGASAVTPLLLLALMGLSLIWWLFGAQDRWLAHAYRESIIEAAAIFRNQFELRDYKAVGDYRGLYNIELPSVRKNPIEWYSRGMSITRLAAYVPLIMLIIWMLLAAFYIYSTDGANYWMLAALIGFVLVLSVILIAFNINNTSSVSKRDKVEAKHG